MATTLKIKVTKQILEKSKWCSTGLIHAAYNCAISLAIRDIFPNACVMGDYINPQGIIGSRIIMLPKEAIDFIEKFDNSSRRQRILMAEQEFEISIPDEVIEKINIEEILPLLENHPNLKFVKRELCTPCIEKKVL